MADGKATGFGRQDPTEERSPSVSRKPAAQRPEPKREEMPVRNYKKARYENRRVTTRT
jgi:hypothetical protein